MKRLFKKAKVDLEITQVPTLVNDSHVKERDLTLKASVIICSGELLSSESVLVTFTGERTTPVPTPLFSISPSEQAKTILLRDTQRAELSKETRQGDLYRYEAPVEFKLPDGLPGTISLLPAPGSSSIRYHLSATFQAGLFSGSSTCSKEIFLFRACRDDVTGLDTFVDNVGCHDDCLNYEVWSMKAVLCGGQARFHVGLNTLKPDVHVKSIRVILKERQIVKVPVPAMHQSRPGELTTMAATFDLTERLIDVPESSSRKAEDKSGNSYNVLFDLSLPESTKGYRRSSATRGGIKLEHYFNIEIGLSNLNGAMSPLKLRSDTALALPTDFESYVPNLESNASGEKRLLVAPPAYAEFAPPSYGLHKIDLLYKGGDTVAESATNQRVIFL